MSDRAPQGGEQATVEPQWWSVGCNRCGHWRRGWWTKAQVADWCRVHPEPVFRQSPVNVASESTCPHPCGTPYQPQEAR